jgi:lipoprotein-anchoring transpeptidase ErfK/SrfK
LSKHERAALPPARSRFRLALLAGIAVAAATWPAAVPARSVSATAVKPTQALVTLKSAHEAFSKPARSSKPIELVQAKRPLTLGPTVLPVLGRYTAAGGLQWVHVMLPGRPNGHTGWISRAGTVVTATVWHIVVHTSTRRVAVYRSGHLVRTVKAIVGKPSTPTPLGEFFVEEGIRLGPSDVGAPFALALSARSDVLQEFDGGPGQIALHGLTNVGGVLGTAVSHGCVRLADEMMRWLIVRLGAGTPVTITP